MSTNEPVETRKPGPVLAAVDFSPISEEVLRRASAIAGAARTELHLAHVLPLPAGAGLGAGRADRDLGFASQMEQARGALDRLASQVTGSPRRVVGHLRVGAVDVELAQLASDLDAELIVVGTHGHKGLDRLLLGSVAESLVRRAPCAVLTCRVKPERPWERIAPACPDCLARQRETMRTELWCSRHAQRHARAHTYWEMPEGYGIGAQTFR